MSKRVLVTGAGGYIGSTLTPLLLEVGYRVRAVDRFFFGEERLPRSASLELVREDTRRLEPRHFADVDAVIDLAALSNDASGDLVREYTWQINHAARVRAAGLARDAGVQRYILPSSCSVYGFQPPGVVADETTTTNPLTTYAQANEQAEHGVLALADDAYCVTVLRQATVYGYSPRMRFDLAINGMTYGAWKDGVLPLMRDGTQWRPMVHVRDAARAMSFMLAADPAEVNGEIFNVGSERNNYQLGPLAEIVAETVTRPVEIEWYGDADTRSYRVNFDRIEALGYRAEYAAEDGVREICRALDEGRLERTPDTITLDWYRSLLEWDRRLQEVRMYGGVLELNDGFTEAIGANGTGAAPRGQSVADKAGAAR